MRSKTWFILTIALTIFFLSLMGGFIIWVDPFFHYHGPLKGVAYKLENYRYQNDGIVRHFDYDTLIIGTSLVANFKTTECDAALGGRSIKVPMYGASFKEINDNLKRALEANHGIKRVIRCLEEGHFSQDKDLMNYEGLPTYLYDNNPFNDYEYLMNKEVAISAAEMLLDTRDGKEMTTFDEYLRWQGLYDFGKKAVMSQIDRPGETTYIEKVAPDEKERSLNNIKQNVTDTARAYPEVEFYYFFSPFSVAFWDVEVSRQGKLSWFMDLQRIVIEEILTCPNIKLYAWDDRFDITTDLENYQDSQHYGAGINSKMLRWMQYDEGHLTKDNYMEYLERVRDFYSQYDFDSLYE